MTFEDLIKNDNISITVMVPETLCRRINCALFADADMGIYLHASSQKHVRLKTKLAIAMLIMVKFPLTLE